MSNMLLTPSGNYYSKSSFPGEHRRKELERSDTDGNQGSRDLSAKTPKQNIL